MMEIFVLLTESIVVAHMEMRRGTHLASFLCSKIIVVIYYICFEILVTS
jgi:uncharacterized membrane protein YobD (UPF0266 family)